MPILAGSNSRIVIQGITGYNGRNIAGRMVHGRTPLVGGITPSRGGATVHGVPVVGSCYEAVQVLGANTTFVSVPAPMAREACEEAIEAGIRLLVVYTEGVPIVDAIQIAAFARARGAVLLGPNAAGCVSPGLANVSDINEANLDPGHVGVVSKSGTLACEVIDGLRAVGLGQSTVVCLGGDAVIATSHRDILQRFEADPQTHCVVLVGEVGGRSELAAAEFVASMRTPVVAYIAGRSAPPGKRMGHAGALLASHEEGAAHKMATLQQAGAHIVADITGIGPAVAHVYARAAGA